MNTHESNNKNVLFLDGDCVFCQRSAQLVHRIDKRNVLHFAPLQGETARSLPEGWRLMDSTNSGAPSAAVLAEHFGSETVWWRGADAILRTLKLIGGFWSYFWPLHHLPEWLKEPVYEWIAKNRYRIAGKTSACELPTKTFAEKLMP